MPSAFANQLRMMARTRTNGEAHMLSETADELDRKEAQIESLIRAIELITDQVKARVDSVYAAVTRHLGPP